MIITIIIKGHQEGVEKLSDIILILELWQQGGEDEGSRAATGKHAVFVISPDQRVPKDHPLRGIRRVADEAFKGMDSVLDEMYSTAGRPSIPPDLLLKFFILVVLYSIRSERLFCEQLDCNLLFRGFLDMDMVEDGFNQESRYQNTIRRRPKPKK